MPPLALVFVLGSSGRYRGRIEGIALRKPFASLTRCNPFNPGRPFNQAMVTVPRMPRLWWPDTLHHISTVPAAVGLK